MKKTLLFLLFITPFAQAMQSDHSYMSYQEALEVVKKHHLEELDSVIKKIEAVHENLDSLDPSLLVKLGQCKRDLERIEHDLEKKYEQTILQLINEYKVYADELADFFLEKLATRQLFEEEITSIATLILEVYENLLIIDKDLLETLKQCKIDLQKVEKNAHKAEIHQRISSYKALVDESAKVLLTNLEEEVASLEQQSKRTLSKEETITLLKELTRSITLHNSFQEWVCDNDTHMADLTKIKQHILQIREQLL